MKKSLFLYKFIIFFVFVSEFVFAQTLTPKNIGIVKYNIIAKPRFAYLKQKGELIFDGKNSVFTSNKGKKDIITQKDEISGQTDLWVEDEFGNVVYKNFVEKSMYLREIVWQQPYISQEPNLPNFDWAIDTTQKYIGKFLCKKATTNFRGRHFIVWFTQEIPISDGPWKFWGLPGLILEAKDEKGDYSFMLESINYPAKDINFAIIKPSDGLSVDFKTFQKADDLEFEKMSRKAYASSGNRGEMSIKKTPQNPIELKYEN
jgi:GLPGLI family protein